METDRELLELAAKAAGIACDERGPYTESPCMQSEFGRGNWIENVMRDWSPLTDDGDALRLAVKLCMTLLIGDGGTVSACIDSDSHSVKAVEVILPDMFAATRRAIVRCAAAIGRMK